MTPTSDLSDTVRRSTPLWRPVRRLLPGWPPAGRLSAALCLVLGTAIAATLSPAAAGPGSEASNAVSPRTMSEIRATVRDRDEALNAAALSALEREMETALPTLWKALPRSGAADRIRKAAAAAARRKPCPPSMASPPRPPRSLVPSVVFAEGSDPSVPTPRPAPRLPS